MALLRRPSTSRVAGSTVLAVLRPGAAPSPPSRPILLAAIGLSADCWSAGSGAGLPIDPAALAIVVAYLARIAVLYLATRAA